VAELAHSLEGLDTYARAGEQTPTRVRRRRKAAWGVAVAGLIVITALLLLALESWRDAGSTTADGPIDISGYCRAELGAMVAVLDEPGSSIWRCTYPDGSSSGPIDIDAVCANRFGPGFSERSEETSGLGLRCSGNVESSDACPIPIGAADDDNDTVTAALPILVPAASKSVSCGSSPVYLWYEAVVQELDFGGAGGGAVMVVQEAGVVLEPPEWTAYDRVRGLPPEVVGYPQGPVVLEDGFFRLDVDQGRRSALVARSRSGPFFWMPAVTYLPWLEQGGIASCLGMPTEDANLTQRRQRFENGEIAQRFSDQGIDIHLDSAC
jgi:hypothetical protein